MNRFVIRLLYPYMLFNRSSSSSLVVPKLGLGNALPLAWYSKRYIFFVTRCPASLCIPTNPGTIHPPLTSGSHLKPDSKRVNSTYKGFEHESEQTLESQVFTLGNLGVSNFRLTEKKKPWSFRKTHMKGAQT